MILVVDVVADQLQDFPIVGDLMVDQLPEYARGHSTIIGRTLHAPPTWNHRTASSRGPLVTAEPHIKLTCFWNKLPRL